MTPSTTIPILYQDDHLLVIEKPAGLLSVPGRGPDAQDCVQSRLLEIAPDCRTVHRLDMATSGLMVFARSANAHRHLSRQFQERRVSKQYHACVSGLVRADCGAIHQPLICDWPNRPRQKVCYEHGKPALTHFATLSRHASAGTSLLALTPITGRSHQLRVHLAHLGHPILGDEFYARGTALAASERLLLHATQLSFEHPELGGRLSFQSPAKFD